MKICRMCNGNKTINGMGYIKEKCKKCDGKGFISEVETLKINAIETGKVKSKDKEKNKKSIRDQ